MSLLSFGIRRTDEIVDNFVERLWVQAVKDSPFAGRPRWFRLALLFGVIVLLFRLAVEFREALLQIASLFLPSLFLCGDHLIVPAFDKRHHLIIELEDAIYGDDSHICIPPDTNGSLRGALG